MKNWQSKGEGSKVTEKEASNPSCSNCRTSNRPGKAAVVNLVKGLHDIHAGLKEHLSALRLQPQPESEGLAGVDITVSLTQREVGGKSVTYPLLPANDSKLLVI